jgi:hypothetical protein
MKRGRPRRVDYEYERDGTANIFMLFAPLEGWRHVEVTDRHAAVDYAAILRDLSDRYFPGASKIILVQDNLSTHTAASLHAAFAPAEARRLAERFEWHYTPKHGSWLDMAAGWTWRSLNSGFCPHSVWIDVSKTRVVSSAKSPHGRSTETNTMPRRTGSSQMTRHE